MKARYRITFTGDTTVAVILRELQAWQTPRNKYWWSGKDLGVMLTTSKDVLDVITESIHPSCYTIRKLQQGDQP